MNAQALPSASYTTAAYGSFSLAPAPAVADAGSTAAVSMPRRRFAWSLSVMRAGREPSPDTTLAAGSAAGSLAEPTALLQPATRVTDTTHPAHRATSRALMATPRSAAGHRASYAGDGTWWRAGTWARGRAPPPRR